MKISKFGNVISGANWIINLANAAGEKFSPLTKISRSPAFASFTRAANQIWHNKDFENALIETQLKEIKKPVIVFNIRHMF